MIFCFTLKLCFVKVPFNKMSYIQILISDQRKYFLIYKLLFYGFLSLSQLINIRTPEK